MATEWWWALAFTARRLGISSARAAWLSGIARAVPRSQPAQPIVPSTAAADWSFRRVFLIFFVTCACNILLRINFCNASHCACRERAMHRIACGCPNKLASTSRLEYGMSHQNLVRAHRPSSKLTYLRVQASLPRKQIEFRVRHATPQVCASTCASIATTQGGGQQL